MGNPRPPDVGSHMTLAACRALPGRRPDQALATSSLYKFLPRRCLNSESSFRAMKALPALEVGNVPGHAEP